MFCFTSIASTKRKKIQSCTEIIWYLTFHVLPICWTSIFKLDTHYIALTYPRTSIFKLDTRYITLTFSKTSRFRLDTRYVALTYPRASATLGKHLAQLTCAAHLTHLTCTACRQQLIHHRDDITCIHPTALGQLMKHLCKPLSLLTGAAASYCSVSCVKMQCFSFPAIVCSEAWCSQQYILAN